MYYDPDEKRLFLFHSCVVIQLPVLIDWSQVKLTLGITCPRHRRLLKARLGWFGRALPDWEWQIVDGEERLVSVGGWRGKG